MGGSRVHITGASGAGVSTLGAALAVRLGGVHLDTDDYYWRPTSPPYREKREVAERLSALREAFAAARGGWVLSGCVGDWGAPLIPLFDRVVYVETATEIRLERLQAREAAVFGAAAVGPGGERREEHVEFLAWASRYEHGDRPGRSRARHEAWLAALRCPVLRVDGRRPVAALVDEVVGR